MTYENMGERVREMCALEILYSSEKHSHFLFFFYLSLFFFSPSRSGLTSKGCAVPRVSRFLCLIKDSGGGAAANVFFVNNQYSPSRKKKRYFRGKYDGSQKAASSVIKQLELV